MSEKDRMWVLREREKEREREREREREATKWATYPTQIQPNPRIQ